MNIKKNVIKDKIDIMLIVLKITIMLFGCIIVYQFLPFYWINDNSEYGYINTKAIGFVLISLILIYASWLLINIFMLNQKSKNKFSCIFEILFYITVISLPIYIFHDYQNKFKYVYLIVIIITIIQYGSGYGIMSALVSGIAILGVDLMYAPTVNNINSYFENDLVLIGVFIILAWILGYYVELVNEYKNEKEKQLKSLSSELEIQCTKRHKIEEMLFKNKMCFDMLFENAQKAIIVHKDDKIIYANQGAAKLLGQEAAIKLEKESIYNYYNEEIREEVKKKYHKIINEKISKQVDEEAILNSKGESIAVRNTSLFFIYEGEPSVLTFLLDVTTEKQLERLKTDARENLKLLNETREFNVLITEFFINISHEIKTPMNIIYMVVQSLEVYLNNNNIENKDKCSEYLKIMKQNCYR
ncbi:MAG: PAS domain S-box protein, partial [Clostridiaceae bacterium]